MDIKGHVQMVAIAAIAVIGSSAGASLSTPPDFFLSLGGTTADDRGFNWNQTGSVRPITETVWNYSGSITEGVWGLAWNIDYDPDPMINANIVVTNNSATTQMFTLIMTMPVAIQLDNASMSGSIIGTVTDQNGNNALVAAAQGGAIYTASIDGAPVQQLLGNGFSQSAGPNGSSVVGPGSFGTSNAGVPLMDNMSIMIQFELSAGDAASFSSIFMVQAVPAPAALPLLAGAGLCLGRRRRRST